MTEEKKEVDESISELIKEAQRQMPLLNKRWESFCDSRPDEKNKWEAFTHLEICTLYALHVQTLNILQGKKKPDAKRS